ncbi:MAG TPA: hypothetical protein VD994_08970 [Prosthecobacter sp.]|nr:hypothetical protein [Prosthecobacter sp.]
MHRTAAVFLCAIAATAVAAPATAPHELGVKGTGFVLDGKPFPYTGVSFFNAMYNPTFDRSTEERGRWLGKFRSYGVNVLRVWCQWDNGRGFVDAGPESTLYEKDGRLRAGPLERLKEILTSCREQGMCVEVVLFAQESFGENIRLGEPADAKAVSALTRELLPFRNAAFQIWNEHTDARVLPLARVIREIDPKRLVTNSPGYAGVMGSDEENAALDYLTPHTSRHGKEPHWERAPRQLEELVKKFGKPVVDDEPARNGTKNFGGPKEETSPFDHVLQIAAVWRVGAYPTYHHDMFQTGYGTPACPASGIPDPEFSRYHRVVFEFLRERERYWREEKGS